MWTHGVPPLVYRGSGGSGSFDPLRPEKTMVEASGEVVPDALVSPLAHEERQVFRAVFETNLALLASQPEKVIEATAVIFMPRVAFEITRNIRSRFLSISKL